MDRAQEILATWRAEGVIDGAKSIQVFDLIYPLIYSAAFAGLCIAAAGAWSRAGRPRLATAGIAMAWVAFAAIYSSLLYALSGLAGTLIARRRQ